MKRRFDVLSLIFENNRTINYWIARIFNDTVATIQTGKVGEVGNVEKIKTDIFNKVDHLVNDYRKEKLREGYREISENDLTELTIIIVPRGKHNFGDEFIYSELSDELDEINDDINDYLMSLGLVTNHYICLMENNNIVLKYYVLNSDLANKMITAKYGEKLDRVRQKIENWS